MTSDTNKLEKIIYNNLELFITYFNIKYKIEAIYFGRDGLILEIEPKIKIKYCDYKREYSNVLTTDFLKISKSKFFTWLELINNAQI